MIAPRTYLRSEKPDRRGAWPAAAELRPAREPPGTRHGPRAACGRSVAGGEPSAARRSGTAGPPSARRRAGTPTVAARPYWPGADGCHRRVGERARGVEVVRDRWVGRPLVVRRRERRSRGSGPGAAAGRPSGGGIEEPTLVGGRRPRGVRPERVRSRDRHGIPSPGPCPSIHPRPHHGAGATRRLLAGCGDALRRCGPEPTPDGPGAGTARRRTAAVAPAGESSAGRERQRAPRSVMRRSCAPGASGLETVKGQVPSASIRQIRRAVPGGPGTVVGQLPIGPDRRPKRAAVRLRRPVVGTAGAVRSDGRRSVPRRNAPERVVFDVEPRRPLVATCNRRCDAALGSADVRYSAAVASRPRSAVQVKKIQPTRTKTGKRIAPDQSM